jgi:hypothetical protein
MCAHDNVGSPRAKVFPRLQDRLLEFRVLKQFHVAEDLWPAIFWHGASRGAFQNRNAKTD